MAFGKKIGPTGRKRDEFNVFVRGYKHPGEQQQHLNRPYRGSYAYEAYGQEGVKEAKRSVHRKYPHKWKKFTVFNESRIHRIAARRRRG